MKRMTKVFWGVVVISMIAGMGWFAYYAIQPKAIPKIKLSVFETPQSVSNALWLRLQEEFKQRPVWILGADPENSDQLSALSIFLNGGPDPTNGFDEIWVDGATGFELSTAKERVVFRGNEDDVKQKLLGKVKANKRILLVTLPVYAATVLRDGPGFKLAQPPELNFGSVVFSELPRNRAQEDTLRVPCVLPHNDDRGTGSLGCWIVQRARLNYRKKMDSGALVGIMDQISSHDFLFLLGREP